MCCFWSQVQATFAGGLAEHLQAAGGANAAVVASLKESISRVGMAADTLSSQVSEGQRRLLQLAEEAAAGALFLLAVCYTDCYHFASCLQYARSCALRCLKHLSFDGTPCGLAVQGLHRS